MHADSKQLAALLTVTPTAWLHKKKTNVVIKREIWCIKYSSSEAKKRNGWVNVRTWRWRCVAIGSKCSDTHFLWHSTPVSVSQTSILLYILGGSFTLQRFLINLFNPTNGSPYSDPVTGLESWDTREGQFHFFIPVTGFSTNEVCWIHCNKDNSLNASKHCTAEQELLHFQFVESYLL